MQQQQQPSSPTAPTATITSTTLFPAATVAADVKLALGLLDGSGGRGNVLGREDADVGSHQQQRVSRLNKSAMSPSAFVRKGIKISKYRYYLLTS